MKLISVTWDHYKKGLPTRDGTSMILSSSDYELEHVPEMHAIRAVHRKTGIALRLDQTGATMQEAPAESPVVPVAPEASGTSRTVKSGRR